MALMTCLGIMTITVLIINLLSPTKPTFEQSEITWEEIATAESDKRDSIYFDKLKDDFLNVELNLHFLNEHFSESVELRNDYKITEFYWDHTLADDQKYKQIGFWGQGICYILSGSIDEGLASLAQVKEKNLPWYNYALAKAFESKNNKLLASKYYEQELKKSSQSYLLFVSDYTRFLYNNQQYTLANELITKYNLHQSLSSQLLQEVFLKSFNLSSYFKIKFNNYFSQISWHSLIAAILIVLIWMTYLVWLDIFEPEKIIYIMLALVGGIVFSNLAILFYDIYKHYLGFKLNGQFVNDLLYSIFAIGLIEEFVKIIPLLLLLTFTKENDEPYDYLLYSGLSALGFAFLENILYFNQEQNFVSFTGRALYSSVAHMIMSNIFAYGLVRARYNKKGNNISSFFVFWFISAVFHGCYDFFLFYNWTILFYVGYLMSIIIWMLLINNTLNNSKFFSYNIAVKTTRVQFFLAVSLTLVFAFDYIMVSFNNGERSGNTFLAQSVLNYGMLIFFFTSKISTFDLVHKYWRNISINKHDEDLSRMNKWNPFFLIMRFFYINSVNPQNYVGQKIKLEPINSPVPYFFEGTTSISGEIIDRPILDGETDKGIKYQDARWFLLRLQNHLPTQEFEPNYLLIKFKDWQASLYKGKNNSVVVLGIPSLAALTQTSIDKGQFKFHGFARIVQDT